MKIDLHSPDLRIIRLACQAVLEGGVVLYPSDTIYGLGCSPWLPSALRRLVEIKGRALTQGMLVLVKGRRSVLDLVGSLPPLASELIDRFWPGPLTLLLDGRPDLPAELLGAAGKIGVRHPRGEFLQTWLEELGIPLVSTSANRSGHPYAGDPESLKRIFGGWVDLFIEAREFSQGQPSTVVDLTTWPPAMVRDGENCEEVRKFLTGGRAGFGPGHTR